MIDLIQAQKDLYGVLMSSRDLRANYIALQRQMQLQSAVDISAVWNTPRNGCAGAGMIVEMPTAVCDAQNVSGPILDWIFPVHILEVPELNFARATPGRNIKGSTIAAETLVQIVLNEVHHYSDARLATFKAERNPVASANIEGIAIGYRVSFSLAKARSVQTPRTGPVTATIDTAAVTLACRDEANIYYTTDGSFPVDAGGGNPQSKLYDGPIDLLPAGSCLRARAYNAAKLGGETYYRDF